MSLSYMVFYPNGEHTQIQPDDIKIYLDKGLTVKEFTTDVIVGTSSKTGKPIQMCTERTITIGPATKKETDNMKTDCNCNRCYSDKKVLPATEHICSGGSWNNETKRFECEHSAKSDLTKILERVSIFTTGNQVVEANPKFAIDNAEKELKEWNIQESIDLLKRVLEMNGNHEGDWKESIRAEIRHLEDDKFLKKHLTFM